MKRLIALALSLAAVMAVNPALAQTALTDFVSQVGDITYNDAATSYINIAACGAPSTTEVTIQLQVDGTLDQVALYVGGQNAACEESINRNGDSAVCFQANGNLQTVETNSQIIVTVADLEASDLIDCSQESPSQQGTPFELYSFRDADPGTGDPEALTWGVAGVTLDISAPISPAVTNAGEQLGTSFTVTFEPSNDNLLRYELFQLPGCDSADGGTTDPVIVPNVTANASANSIGVTAGQLGLGNGETTALFVRALDQAENEGDLSTEEVCVEAIATGGFCASSGECEGCSVSAAGLGRSLTKGGMVGLLLFFAVVGWRRLR